MNLSKEFFYVSNEDTAKQIVDHCVNSIDQLVANYDGDYSVLQSKFIDDPNIDIKDQQLVTLTIEPVNRGRSRSKSPNRIPLKYFVTRQTKDQKILQF